MISTALALQDATGNAVIDITTMIKAKSIYNARHEMSDQEFADAMFEYSAHLASITAAMVTNAVLTKEQLHELNATIAEMNAMGKDLD